MVTFVLHRPRNPHNIGAAARGIANFGFQSLVVVAPYERAWQETRAAVHAEAVVMNAKKYQSLKTALRKHHLVIGTSAGTRRATSANFISLEQMTRLAHECAQQNRRVAVVFGNEKSGLSNKELAHCRYVTRIPTDPACPSMNLAQSVAIVAYALRFPASTGIDLPALPKLPKERVERLIAHGLEAFTAAGLLKGWDSERSERRIRKAFTGWNLTAVDAAMLHGLFRWVLNRTGNTVD